VIIVPDADHVNTSICPGVSNTTYLVCTQQVPNYPGFPKTSLLKMTEKIFYSPDATPYFTGKM